jgi:large subunit ribosomal protein L5
MSRLHDRYKTDIVREMRAHFGYTNVMQVPKVEKVVVNMRVADALQDQRHLDKAVEELTLISGQRPVITRAHRSIAAFKLRAGNPIGCKVTLRGERMYEFLDKLVNIALPRIKDFKGLSARSFDGRGGLNIGIREQLIFPEIDYDKVDKIRGMDITIVTTARTDEEARELLRGLGMPFREAAPGGAG